MHRFGPIPPASPGPGRGARTRVWSSLRPRAGVAVGRVGPGPEGPRASTEEDLSRYPGKTRSFPFWPRGYARDDSHGRLCPPVDYQKPCYSRHYPARPGVLVGKVTPSIGPTSRYVSSSSTFYPLVPVRVVYLRFPFREDKLTKLTNNSASPT